MKIEIIKRRDEEIFLIRKKEFLTPDSYLSRDSESWYCTDEVVREACEFTSIETAMRTYNAAIERYKYKMVPIWKRLFKPKYTVLKDEDIATRLLGYTETE